MWGVPRSRASPCAGDARWAHHGLDQIATYAGNSLCVQTLIQAAISRTLNGLEIAELFGHRDKIDVVPVAVNRFRNLSHFEETHEVFSVCAHQGTHTHREMKA
jgi:hypothetical protein